MVDAETGEVVEADQKARGYELARGKHVEIEPDELDAIQLESSHTIEIDSFVPAEEIDQRYLNHPYYIAQTARPPSRRSLSSANDEGPGPSGTRPHRAHQSRACDGDRAPGQGPARHHVALPPTSCATKRICSRAIKSANITRDMVELAGHILDSKAAHFDPSEFKDEYERALKELSARPPASRSRRGKARNDRAMSSS
jgi:DNA end-binding protein Ku